MTHRLKVLRIPLLAVLAAALLTAGDGSVRPPLSFPSLRPSSGAAPETAFVPGQILVKFYPGVRFVGRIAAFASHNLRPIRKTAGLDVYTVRIPSGADVRKTAEELGGEPDVMYAEPNYICRADATPNDLLFKYQYALANTGQTIGDVPGSPQGKAEADIKAPQAWEETTGDDSVTIAILDSGVDLTHPDLAGKLAGPGRDFVNNDLDATDDYYHGTAVAGIAAAATDNDEGIAGVAWNAKILPVKVLDATGAGTADKVADGILWAVSQNARVINLSLGFDASSQTLLSAIQYAYEQGCVIVASVGNTGGDVRYPAAYDDYVLAVAATDYNDEVLSTSNKGDQVDVAAPGADVLATVPTWFLGASALPYALVNGTSIAAPHVAGLAALLKSQKPWLTPNAIKAIVELSADDVNFATLPGKDVSLGYGRINMEKALVPRPIIENIP
ncbi:MAG: S8 family serine peptidase [Candidatus Aminicenantales bacterium]